MHRNCSISPSHAVTPRIDDAASRALGQASVYPNSKTVTISTSADGAIAAKKVLQASEWSSKLGRRKNTIESKKDLCSIPCSVPNLLFAHRQVAPISEPPSPAMKRTPSRMINQHGPRAITPQRQTLLIDPSIPIH